MHVLPTQPHRSGASDQFKSTFPEKVKKENENMYTALRMNHMPSNQ